MTAEQLILRTPGGGDGEVVPFAAIDAIEVRPVTRTLRLVWRSQAGDAARPTSQTLWHCHESTFGAVVEVLRHRVRPRAWEARFFDGYSDVVLTADDIVVIERSFTGRRTTVTRHSRALLSEIDHRGTCKLTLRFRDESREITVRLSGPDIADAVVRAVGPRPDQLSERTHKAIEKGTIIAPWRPLTRVASREVGPEIARRERRIGRVGRRAEMVPFMSTAADGFFARALVGPAGTPISGRVSERSGRRRGELQMVDDDGRDIISVADRRIRAPWAARRVRADASGDELELRVDVFRVWFQTSWRVETPAAPGKQLLTITEPLRDGLTRRFVRGPARVLANDGGNDFWDTIFLMILMGVAWLLLSPVRLFKSKFRYIVRDETGRRVGVIEHEVDDFTPANTMVAWFDVAELVRWNPTVLAAALLVPMQSTWV